jgi:hypothetical protein
MSENTKHPSESELLLAADGELAPVRAKQVAAHLKACWPCRGLMHDIEDTIAALVSAREAAAESEIPPAGPGRALLFARLQAARATGTSSSSWTRIFPYLGSKLLPALLPKFPAPLFVGFASLSVLAAWFLAQPRLSPRVFLERAIASSSPAAEPKDGVIYQKVRIETPQGSWDREIYRDSSSRRHAKPEPHDTHLEAKLATAEVSWDAPLSAATYKDWRDRQQVSEDDVTANDGLVTLSTFVSSGPILSESLTVRQGDFHPVDRTIEFRGAESRDTQRVEIAELDYRASGWTAATEQLFEPLQVQAATPMASPSLRFLSKTEADEAELMAKLILNRLGADMSERLEIHRGPTTIRVTGIVATAERKRELEMQLRSLPHVSSSLFTFEDMQGRPQTAPSLSVAVAAAGQPRSAATVSPLEKYLLQKGRSADEISVILLHLVDSSMVVSQESKAIDDLRDRFKLNADRSKAATAALAELLERHRAHLFAQLNQQEQSLLALGIDSPSPAPTERLSGTTLSGAAERNRELCKSLISGGSAPSLPVESLALHLAESIGELRAVARDSSATFPTTQALSER